jgi:hypothetical protein
MNWSLEELAEDAVVSLLRKKLPGNMRAYTAYSTDDPQYPCAVVGFDEAEPVSEPAEHHDALMIGGSVQVWVEYAPELDGSGNVLMTPRERNARARSAVIDALAVSDLKQQLIDQGVEDIAFSFAQLMPGRRREAADKALVTTLPIAAIVEPVGS